MASKFKSSYTDTSSGKIDADAWVTSKLDVVEGHARHRSVASVERRRHTLRQTRR